MAQEIGIDRSDSDETAPPIGVGGRDEDKSVYLAAYVGLSWPDFANAYERLRRGRNPLSWSWVLFLFPWIWLVYRKLYPLGFAVWVCDIATFEVFGQWAAVAALPIHLFIGAYGRSLLVRRALREIDRTRQSVHPEQAVMDALKDQGIGRGAALFGVVIAMTCVATIFYDYPG
jgi:hypothetical protein